MGVVNGENARDVTTHIGINLITGGTMSQAQEALGKSVTVRTSPHVVAGNSSPTVPNIAPHAIVTYVGIVDDLDHPSDPAYKWLDLGGGSFVNYVYPPNGQRFTLLTPPPPPPGSPKPPPASPRATRPQPKAAPPGFALANHTFRGI